MIETDPLLAAAPIVGLAAYCLAHVVASRLLAVQSPYPALAVGSVFGLAAAVTITFAGLGRADAGIADGTAQLAMNVVAYLGLAFGYFNFVNLTVASLRIRLLEELLDSPGPLLKSSLLGQYDSSAVAATRIERLLRGGHIVERDGRYYRGRWKFLAVARIFDTLRFLILGPNPTCDRTSPA